MSNAQENLAPMSRTALVSLSSGICFIISTLVAVALLNVPKPAAAGGSSLACPLVEVSLDQGYGVSRTGFQPVCREAADQAGSANTAAR